jgi:hypothetical protein
MGEFTTGSEPGKEGLGSTNKRNLGHQIDEHRDPEASDSARLVPGTDQNSVFVADSQGEIQANTTEVPTAHTADQLDADTTAGGATGLGDSTTEPIELSENSISQSGVRNGISSARQDGGGGAGPRQNRSRGTGRSEGRRNRTRDPVEGNRKNHNRVLQVIKRSCKFGATTAEERSTSRKSGGRGRRDSVERIGDSESNQDKIAEPSRDDDTKPIANEIAKPHADGIRDINANEQAIDNSRAIERTMPKAGTATLGTEGLVVEPAID